MKNLQEFDTLGNAHSFSKATYSDITSNQAEQFFGLTGYIDALESNVDNPTVVTVIGGMPTTIGKLIKTVLKTMNKSGGVFKVDVNTDAGQLNRACATILHEYDVLPEHVTDAFISLGERIEYPYIDVTPEQFAACKDAYSLEHKQEHDLTWNRQSRLRVTLLEDLYEPRMVTLFYTDDFFKHKNVGRPTLMHKADEYLIDLKGVTQTGTLHINFGVKYSADCELV